MYASTTFFNSTRHFETVEIQYHEELYENLLLLTKVHATTKDFDEIFTEDMFVRNNKAAFHHVIYYLLEVLDADVIKEKIKSWPIFEIRMESKFRAEVLVYINELNTMYENAHIPLIMPSHLIIPGGYKFVKFMLKLSQFVLYQHLSKNIKVQKELLLCGEPKKENKSIIADNLREISIVIDGETKIRCKNFQEYRKISRSTATRISLKQLELNELLKTLKLDLVEKKQYFDGKYPAVTSVFVCEAKVKEYNKHIEIMDKFTNMYIETCKMVGLLNKPHILQHNTDLKVNGREFKPTEKLNIIKLWSNLIESLRFNYQTLPKIHSSDVKNAIKLVLELIEKSSECYENLCQIEVELMNCCLNSSYIWHKFLQGGDLDGAPVFAVQQSLRATSPPRTPLQSTQPPSIIISPATPLRTTILKQPDIFDALKKF